MRKAIKRLGIGLLSLGLVVGTNTVQAQPFITDTDHVASDTMSNDGFGVSISVSDTLMAVGSYKAISDNSGTVGGAVYLFRLGTDGNWTEFQKLTASDRTAGDEFGWAVSLQPNGLAIGAPKANGDKGAVYFFAPNSAGTWVEKEIFQYCSVVGDQCGYAVDLQSDTQGHQILAGSPGVANNTGSYRFISGNTSATSWAYGTPPTIGVVGDRLGEAVALSGNHFAVAAPSFNNDQGKVYVFDDINSSYSQTYTGAASNDFFGLSLAMDNNRLLVGINDIGSGGKAYLYEHNGTNWTAATPLSQSNINDDMNFGRSVDVFGARIAVGGMTYNLSTNLFDEAVYIFDFDGTTWNQVQKLSELPPLGFGKRDSVALSNKRIAIGAKGKIPDAGKAWVFREPTIGGNVTGLSGTLVLQNNNGDNLTLTADGSFAFYTPMSNGDSYNVSILNSPVGQLCNVVPATASGNVGNVDITNVQINCVNVNTYTVGGTVGGLTFPLTLQNNGGDDLTISADGTFTFSTPVNNTSGYTVTALPQSGQVCTLSNDSGTINGADITNVTVSCSAVSTHNISVNIGGLDTNEFLTVNNGSDSLLGGNGPSSFFTAVNNGGTYNVTIPTQPTGKTCVVTNGSGTVSGTNVVVPIACTVNTYTISVTVNGLNGNLVIQNNSGDNLSINTDGPFTFSTPVVHNNPYLVTVFNAPSGQFCTVTNDSGNAVADVSNVQVNCLDDVSIGGVVNGLSGIGITSPLVLHNNGGDSLTLTTDGSFTFANKIRNGGLYDVTIAGWPSEANCSISSMNGSGTATADVTNISIYCHPETFLLIDGFEG